MANNNPQLETMVYAIAALWGYFRDCSDVHVRADMILYYEEGKPTSSVAPDLFVVRGIREAPQDSYRLWEVGVVPQFVMEVASKSTYRRDRDEKFQLYEGLGIGEYWRYDPQGGLLQATEVVERLRGWELDAQGRYKAARPRGGGELRSRVLGLDLCVVQDRLQFWDYGRRRFLPWPAESERLLEESERRLAEAVARIAELENPLNSG